MKTYMQHAFFVAVLILLFITVSANKELQVSRDVNILRPVVEKPNVHSNNVGSPNQTGLDWGYGCDEGIGPENWGTLSANWSLCNSGKQQSPIRILTFDVVEREVGEILFYKYFKSPASLINDGHALRMKWNAGSIRVAEVVYELEEVIFRSPAEHSLNGKIYPMEMQMVHKSAVDGRISIVSLMFKLDDDANQFLDQFWQYLPSRETNEVVSVDAVDPDWIEIHQKHFYRYIGSLTTPPCTEGIVWTVMTKTYKLTPMQLDTLTGALKKKNARPVQPLNGRVVYKRT